MRNFERLILRDLYESTNGLFGYTFYSRYKIEPENILKFIEKYKERGLLSFENDKLTLTDNGRKFILKRLYKVPSRKDKFTGIPSAFIDRKLEINTPYLPDIRNVSFEIIKK